MATHASSWRSLLALAPGMGVAVIGLAVVRGMTDMATTRAVYLFLAPLAAFGWLAAGRMARLFERPVVSIASAQAGAVALRGVARPFPGQSLLKAPDGSDCLWFDGSAKKRGTIATRNQPLTATPDSVAPFLLVDDTGQCIVLPAGAAFPGGHEGSASSINGSCIADGDRLFVAGVLEAPSNEAIRATRAALEAAARQPRPGIVSADDVHDPSLADVSLISTIPVPALPLVRAGDGAFTLVAKGGESGGSWYGLLKIVNLVVLVASLAMCAWLTLRVASG